MDLVDEIFLEFADAADLEDLLRNDKTIGELLTFDHMVASLDDQVLCERDEVLFFHAGLFIANNDDALVLLNAAEVDDTIDLGNFSSIFRTCALQRARQREEDRR